MGSPNMIALSEDWLSTTWGELVELKYGKALKGYKESTGEFPVYGTNGPVGWCEKPLCEFPSVIVGRKGAYRGIHFSEKPFYVIDTAFYIQPKSEVDINLKWAYYALLLADINSMDSGSAIPSTSREDFYALSACMPPRDIQDWIVSQLDVLNGKIELNRQINTTLESMAQALFKSWFVGFDPVIDNALAAGNPIPDELIDRAERRKSLRENPANQHPPLPPDIQQLFPSSFVFTEEMGWVPEGWDVKPLSGMIELIGGGTPKTSIEEYWGGDIPWFSVVDAPSPSDVFVVNTEKSITQFGLDNSSSKLLPKGTTIISARGTVGKCAVVARPMAMNQSCYGLRGKDGNADYFTYYLVLRKVHELQQHSHGSVFSTITRDTFKGLNVAASKPALTQKFDSLVSGKLERILKNLEQNFTLCDLRDRLLPKLLSGQLQIPEAEQQLAEVI